MPTPTINFGISERFFRALTGAANPKITFQTFADKKGGPNELAGIKHGTLKDCAQWLTAKNKAGAGVFFMVNEGDGRGRSSSNVRQARAQFVDLDGRDLPTEWALQPDLIVSSSPGKFHVYWGIEPTDDLAAWSDCQARLAAYYGGDPTVTDYPRVLRVPGFVHQKGEPYLVDIIHETAPEPFKRSVTDIASAHPCEYVKPGVKVKQTKVNDKLPDDLPEDQRAALAYLEDAPISIEGEGGNNTAFKVACYLNDLGLSVETSAELLVSSGWNDRCLGPWSDAELLRICRNAAKYKDKPTGTKSTAAIADEFADDDYNEVSDELGQAPITAAPTSKVEKPKKRPRFLPLNLADLRNLPPMEWLIEGLIPAGQLWELYGPRKAGKTFLSLDMGLCIATGMDWHGRKVKKGRVLHIVGEGNLAGVRNRIEAWLIHHAGDDPMLKAALLKDILANWKMIGLPVHIDRPDTLTEFLATVGGPWDLVIVDTLLRNMAGNVNAVEDAQKFVAACDKIRFKLHCAVMVVHHEGKDQSRGSMGSTAIEAAVDGAARIFREGRRRVFDITLSRDASEDQPRLIFELQRVVIEVGDFEEDSPQDVTSAVMVLVETVAEDPIGESDATLIVIAAWTEADGIISAPKIAAKRRIPSKTTIQRHKTDLVARGLLNADFTLTDAGNKLVADLTAKDDDESEGDD